MQISEQIKAILFWKGEPVSKNELAKILSVTEEEILSGIETLRESMKDSGIALFENADEFELRTSGELSELFQRLTKEEYEKDLTKVALETLSIILYQGPIRRSEIDYIRGVNSQFIIRNLLVRGLIDKDPDPKDSRSFVYKPSFELLAHLNIKSINEMPEYESVRAEIESFKAAKEEYDGKTEEADKVDVVETEDVREENV